VITSWWKSFFQVGTTGDWYIFAKNFWHSIFAPHRWLCWLVTKKDLSEISGISLDLHLKIFSKFSEKIIYEEFWPFLFTHFWVSGPIVFNASVALWGYINSLVLDDFIEQFDISKMWENEKNDFVERMFLQKNIVLQLTFWNLEKIPKRIIKFFELTSEKNEISLELQDYRSWKEAKITWWWIKIDELTHHLESKFIPGLYFAGEVLDITGKTWWFNLQFAWTSGFVVGKNL
jgi:predicted flavoprotein YhiN